MIKKEELYKRIASAESMKERLENEVIQHLVALSEKQEDIEKLNDNYQNKIYILSEENEELRKLVRDLEEELELFINEKSIKTERVRYF